MFSVAFLAEDISLLGLWILILLWSALRCLQDNHAFYFAEGKLLQSRNVDLIINLLEKKTAD